MKLSLISFLYTIPYILHKVVNLKLQKFFLFWDTFILIPWACLRAVYNPVQSVGDVGDNGKVSHKVTEGALIKD